MKGFHEKLVASKSSSSNKATNESAAAAAAAATATANSALECKSSRTSSSSSFFSVFFASAFSVFEHHHDASPSSSSSSSTPQKKELHSRHHHGWALALKKIVAVGSMRRFHERVLGTSRTGVACDSDIWLLGVCYKLSQDESGDDATTSNEGLIAFTHDFSSRILVTYRKGFDAIGDSKLTSDVGWGCMIRSSQMLIAQALLFHRLGRSWGKPPNKPFNQEYIEILHLFGDSEMAPFSIHNLIQAGNPYGLAAGSWVGPYAMCRSWESLARSKREETGLENQSLPMAVYVVSGDEDGERGGAPVVCVEDASRHCLEFSKGQADWTPILLLVPLVLGLDKVNPRYIPSLQATFTFPQSVGILGGKPGASTYIVGVQDDNAFYLDPHDVQPVISINRHDVDADTSSYHSDIIRHIPLDSIDPSLAIGFYCRDKDDFNNFCSMASKLADESNGAPLYTVIDSHKPSKKVSQCDVQSDTGDDTVVEAATGDKECNTHDDEWQLL